MLISGMAAQDLLLCSDLIKWYIHNGLVVTAVHEALEFVPSKPFVHMVSQIENMRRAADANPSMKIQADIAKLIG